jgi:5-methyltetrahydropteroyltriglutamate--homocysteine methyltransferase
MRIQRRLRLVPHPGRTRAWDIHSPRVPSATEIETGLRIAVAYLPVYRIWVKPNCDLKTFRYAEVEPALRILVAGARAVRTPSAS